MMGEVLASPWCLSISILHLPSCIHDRGVFGHACRASPSVLLFLHLSLGTFNHVHAGKATRSGMLYLTA